MKRRRIRDAAHRQHPPALQEPERPLPCTGKIGEAGGTMAREDLWGPGGKAFQTKSQAGKLWGLVRPAQDDRVRAPERRHRFP